MIIDLPIRRAGLKASAARIWRILGVALLAAPSPGQSAPVSRPAISGVDELARAILLRAAEGEVLSGDRLLAALSGAEPSTVTVLHEAATGAPRTGYPRLKDSERKTLAAAIEQVPRAATALLAGEDMDAQEAREARLLALRSLGHVGRAPDLRPALALAATSSSGAIDRAVRTELESAISEILRRDRAGYAAIGEVLREGETDVEAILVGALGRSGTRDALQLLSDRLGRNRALDLPILSQMGRIAARQHGPADPILLRRVRPYLKSRDVAIRREAAMAVGRLEDEEAVPELIGLLGEDNPGVQSNAYWALKRITGMALAPEPHRWKAWYDRESEWRTSRAPAVLDNLSSAGRAEIVAAIQEIATKRLFRGRLAERLVPLLQHPDADIVGLTCTALMGLRSYAPVPSLIELLDHGNEAVKHNALRALVAITGKERPPERKAWLDLLS
jgi:HEAT repeat protein